MVACTYSEIGVWEEEEELPKLVLSNLSPHRTGKGGCGRYSEYAKRVESFSEMGNCQTLSMLSTLVSSNP